MAQLSLIESRNITIRETYRFINDKQDKTLFLEIVEGEEKTDLILNYIIEESEYNSMFIYGFSEPHSVYGKLKRFVDNVDYNLTLPDDEISNCIVCYEQDDITKQLEKNNIHFKKCFVLTNCSTCSSVYCEDCLKGMVKRLEPCGVCGEHFKQTLKKMEMNNKKKKKNKKKNKNKKSKCNPY